MTYELINRIERDPFYIMPFGTDTLSDFFFAPLEMELPKMFEGDFAPAVNIFEKDGKYNIVAEVPGMNKDDISVTVDKDLVTISGKKESTKEEKQGDYYLKETSSGSFSRSFRLPNEVDETKVDANYKDGILTVTLDCKEGSETKKVEVH